MNNYDKPGIRGPVARLLGKQVDQLLLIGIGVPSADLRRDFEITAGGIETIGGKPTTRIQLVPKDSDLKKQAEKIEMWVMLVCNL